MSSQEEERVALLKAEEEKRVALLKAKLATILEPYQKAGINTDNCTLKGVVDCCLLLDYFAKIQKFLHHLLKEGIFPQLMERACEKGIISSASSLTADEIWNIDTWLRTKEGQTSIQDEFNIRKSKRKAAKQLHKEMSSSSNEMERKVDDEAPNAVKRARML